jgi:cyclohexyl-isocyanide hydratase
MLNHGPELEIGAIVFPGIDQADLTGPFEVLSRIPSARFRLLWKEKTPVCDVNGFVLTPDETLSAAPPLDVLVVPGGRGQEALMDDEAVLGFIQAHAARGSMTLSVCTGALLCGAAGILRGARATTHWASHHLLGYFGAIPIDARVVVDGKLISAAGVTAGIDGALRIVSILRGGELAQQIQLMIEYAPEPPFSSGTSSTAPPDVIAAVRASYGQITEERTLTARRVAARLGIETE